MASTNNQDLLTFADLKNNARDADSLNYFNQRLQPKGYLPIGSDINKTYSILDEILTDVNIKRACCMGSNDPTDPSMLLVNARLPKPTTYTAPSNTIIGQIYNKYGFIDQSIKIPKKLCKTLADSGFTSKKSTACQNFYTVYCRNITNEYKAASGSTDKDFDYNEFMYYKPECSCFAPTPQYLVKSGVNAPPVCFLPGCDDVDGVYLDPVSSSDNSNCNLTICQANIDMSQLNAGRDIGIQNKIQQNCGTGSNSENNVDDSMGNNSSNTIFNSIPLYNNINDFINKSAIGNIILDTTPSIKPYSGALILLSLILFLVVVIIICSCSLLVVGISSKK